MLGHYFKTAFRVFGQYKQYVFINVLGLSIGLAAAILVALFAQYELSFDKKHLDSENVYRLHVNVNVSGLEEIPLTLVNIAQTLKKRSDIEDIFYLTDVIDEALMSDQVKINDQKFTLRNVYGASSNITQLIDFKVLHGNLHTALSQPNKIALSASEARRLFGKTKVIGELIQNYNQALVVAAVFNDLPDNSHFLFHSLVTLDLIKHNEITSFIYAKTIKYADLREIEKGLANTLISHYGLKNSKLIYHLVAMKDIYFNAHSPFEFKPGGSSFLVSLSIILSLLLVCIASANYINMSIAQLMYRSKEIAVRKTLGASKPQLISQFLIEAMFMVSLSALFAMCWVELLLPSFSEFAQRPLRLVMNIETAAFFLSLVIILGFIAGAYPAFLVTRASLRNLLIGELKSGRSANTIRKWLLIFQSAMAIALISCTLICLQQLAFLQTLKMGYQSKGRVIVHNLNSTVMMQKEHAILEQIRKLSGVNQVTTSDTDLTDSIMGAFVFRWPNGYEEQGLPPTIGTGFYAVESFGLELLAGRDFLPKYQSDWLHSLDDEPTTDSPQAMSIIVTEQMVKRAGYQNLNDVIGSQVTGNYRNITATIVGVVADIKIGSAKDTWVPLSFSCGYSSQSSVDLVINSPLDNLPKLYQDISILLDKFDLTNEPTFSLMHGDYQKNYNVEKNLSMLISRFALLAITLTCVGLFGLASFSALRRQKEVAMRKVLGATRISIANLLAKEFLNVVLLAMFIALPVSFLIMDQWLSGFNERIEQSWWVYVVATGSIATITWLSVASIAFKAASTRPSLILRDE